MEDNLTIEVQGSSDNAASALDKIIAKIDELQAKFDKAAPSVSKFAEQMEKIASSSRQWSSFDKMASSVDKQAQASKKAEANMAMYDARLQRANVSLERSRAAHDKLVASMEKMSSVQKAIENNNAAFSMSPEEFAAKYDHTNNGGVNLTPEVPGERQIPQLPRSAPSALASDMLPNLSKTATINVDTSQAQSAVARLGEFIDGLNPNIANMSAEAQARFNELSEELMRTGAQMDNLNAIYHNLAVRSGEVAAKSGESSDAYLQLEKRMLSTAASADRLGAKQEKLKSEMSDLASSANSASTSVSNIGNSSARAAAQSESGLGRITRMAQNMFLRIAMFRIFSAVQQGIVTGIQNMALASGQANVAMSALSTNSLYLKNSLAAAAMPAIQAMVPALNQMTNALADAFNAIGMLTARIFNHASSVTIAKRSYVDYAKTINQSGNNSAQVAQKEAENQAKAAEKASKAHDAAAKKQAAAEERVQDAIKKHQQKIDALKKSIMGFDELNVLKDQTDTWEAPKAPDYMSDLPSTASYNTAATPAWNGLQSPTTMFETVPIPAWVKKVGAWTDKIAGFIQNSIDTIHHILIGAPFVIGAILAFSGANIPLGVALMAIGAVEIGKQAKLDWEFLTNKTNTSLEKTKKLLVIAGAVELAIGAILAFSGANVPLGIALMIGGITTTAATLNWNSINPSIQKAMGGITFTSAIAMLALGAIMAFSGANIPLGVGLLIGGATTMWASAALNWNSMDTQIKQTIGKITAITGGLLLAIGMILALTGVNVPLGIGLIAGGAIVLGSAVALNWDSLKTSISSQVTEIVKFVSKAFIALGAVLAFSGVNVPLGIALMASGAVGLVSTSKIDWNYIPNKVKGALNQIQDTATAWFNNGKKQVYGFVNGIIGAINGAISGINWVLGAVGSKTKISLLRPLKYAHGIGSHPGGPALVNDQAGSLYRELVQLPTGKTFIPQGRNVLIPDLPRGSKVLPAKETHTLFPHYAGGIGAFFGNAISSIKDFGTTMWKYISEPKKLFQLAVDKFVNAIHINEPWLSLGNSAVKFVTNHVADALKGIFAKFSPPSGAGGYGVDRWSGIATQALHMTGQYSSANLSRLLMQMQSESGGNPYSINKWDSNWAAGHPSKGLMQLIDSTFRSYAYPGYGSNIYDPLSNILASIRYTVSRYGSLAAGWRGHGYESGIGKIDFAGWNADGALFTKPALAGVGEAGPEAALPLNDGVFSQIARGIQKNGGEDRDIDILNRMDSISERLERLEKAILERPVNLYTTDEKIAESANKGNRSIARRYNS